MSKPVIAIVGRPNVGKSTLFNKLIGERRSIVEDTPGVTRDRIYGETEWRGRTLVMIDTGGIEPKTDDIILAQMRNQAQIAIDTADVIIFVCDVHTGVTANDRDIATMLQNFASRPDFIAFSASSVKWHSLAIHLLRLMNPWFVAWTVRSQADMDKYRKQWDLQIFERFEAQRDAAPSSRLS